MKGKIIIVGNWIEQPGRDLQWLASPAARLLCCIAQVLLIQRLPVSHHTGGAWLATGNAGVFQLALSVSARFTIPTAQLAELTLLRESSTLSVQIKQGSLTSNVIETSQFLLLSVRALNLYFSSWYIFLNVGLFKNRNDSKCILKASTFHW